MYYFDFIAGIELRNLRKRNSNACPIVLFTFIGHIIITLKNIACSAVYFVFSNICNKILNVLLEINLNSCFKWFKFKIMQNHLLTVSPPQANEIFCIVCWKRVSLHSVWIARKNWVFICNSTFMPVHWVTQVLFSILDICSSFYENVWQNFEENYFENNFLVFKIYFSSFPRHY